MASLEVLEEQINFYLIFPGDRTVNNWAIKDAIDIFYTHPEYEDNLIVLFQNYVSMFSEELLQTSAMGSPISIADRMPVLVNLAVILSKCLKDKQRHITYEIICSAIRANVSEKENSDLNNNAFDNSKQYEFYDEEKFKKYVNEQNANGDV